MFETCSVRVARGDDCTALMGVERDAAQRYRDTPMAALADSQPRPELQWHRRVEAGDVLVAVLPSTRVLGFVILRDLERRVFVEELAVQPSATGRHIEDRLLDAAARTAADRGASALVIAACRNVAWSGPYYLRLAFRTLSEADVKADPELLAIRRAEVASGLDACQRVFLSRPV